MKHKILGWLTLSLVVGYVAILLMHRFGAMPAIPQIRMPDFSDIDFGGMIPNWSAGTWTLAILAVILWLTAFVFLVYGAAKRDKFLMFPAENNLFTVMKSDLPCRFISGVSGVFIVQDGPRIGEVREIPQKALSGTATPKERAQWEQDWADYEAYLKHRSLPARILESILVPLINARWLGFYPFYQLRKTPFRYNKFVKETGSEGKKDETGINYHLEPRDGISRSVFYMNTVGMSFTDLETAGANNQVVPVRIDLLVTFRARNIYKMQFRTGSNSWLDRATGAIEDQVRVRVAKHSYYDLLQDRRSTTPETPGGTCKTPRQDLIEGVIRVVNDGDCTSESDGSLNPSIIDLLGVEVVEIRLLNVDLSDDKASAQRQRLGAAMIAEMVEEAEGKGAFMKAKYAAKSTLVTGGATNTVLRNRLENYANNPGATPGLFAESVAGLGTLAIGGDAANRLFINTPASPSRRPRPTPTPAPVETT